MKQKFLIEDDGMHDLFIRVDREYVSLFDYYAGDFFVSVYPEGEHLGVHGKDVWYQNNDQELTKGRLDQDYKITGAEGNQCTFNTGNGDDILIGWRIADEFNAGGGHNKIIGGAGSDEINISRGKNFVKGGNQGDEFDIGGGKSTIVGGSGEDSYYFYDDSKTVITDFEAGLDSIDIYAYGYDSFNDLSVEKHQGGTLIIATNPKDSREEIEIFIENLKPRELDRGDFSF